MIARSKPLPLIEPSCAIAFEVAALWDRVAAYCAALFGFLCFMPYPAIPFGNNSAVQLGNILTLLVLGSISLRAWGRVPTIMVVALLTPLMLSTLKVLIVDDADASLCYKATISWAVSLLTIVAVYAQAPRYALEMLTGIAAAILIHVAVGIWQLYSFGAGVFPMAEFYVNPSFLSVQDNATTIARWTQRPFGLFPEPSAMSSSLAPFVLFFMAVCFGMVRMRRAPSTWHRALFATAAAGGLGLIIVSRSGHTAPTVLGVMVLLAMWVVRSRATMRTVLVLFTLLGAMAPLVVLFAFDMVSGRMGGASDLGNASWDERFHSILIGFQVWSERGFAAGIFGLGPGVSTLLIRDATGIGAVFSVLLSYLYETGFIGFIAIAWVAQRIFASWRESRMSVVFAVIAIVWLIGVTLTTSYSQLLPLWIALGWLSCWSMVCEAPVQQKNAAPAQRRLPPRELRARATSWTVPMKEPA